MSTPRYALYFAPAQLSPWRAFGSAWLGRCAVDGAWRLQPQIEGVDALTFKRLTDAPRRYGFHATLKAPFRLAPGETINSLREALDAFCSDRPPLVMANPEARRLKHFLALTWPVPEARVNGLAAQCVGGFERFRAALDPAELNHRLSAGLTPRQDALLRQWGYPYVFDEFKFHFSLTGALGALSEIATERVLAAVQVQLAALRAHPFVFDAISLFEEPAPAAPLRVVHRGLLSAAEGRLLYVIGPSGAGKDSVIGYARGQLPAGARVRFAHRVITRASAAGGEEHSAVTPQEFVLREARSEFVMAWRANGHAYGIGREVLAWLAAGDTVVVNGSRAYAAQAAALFPSMEMVSIEVRPETLRARLQLRARESADAIEARLARLVREWCAPRCTIHRIHNDGELAHAGTRMLALLLALPPVAGPRD